MSATPSPGMKAVIADLIRRAATSEWHADQARGWAEASEREAAVSRQAARAHRTAAAEYRAAAAKLAA